jgi:hypothetical protein
LERWGNGITVPIVPRVINTGGGASIRIDEHGNVRSVPNAVGAKGGIVTRPTPVVIGEAGDEAVVPLDRMPGASPLPGRFPESTSGGDTYQITIEGFVNETSIQMLTDAIDEIERRKGGTL